MATQKRRSTFAADSLELVEMGYYTREQPGFGVEKDLKSNESLVIHGIGQAMTVTGAGYRWISESLVLSAQVRWYWRGQHMVTECHTFCEII